MAEQDIFIDANVKITTARVIIDGTTYALRNITSVENTYTPPNRGWAIALLIFGVLSLIGAFKNFSTSIGLGFGTLVFATILIALAVLQWLRAKTDYHVTLTTAAGESEAFTSQDCEYIDKIVNHINDAMVKHEQIGEQVVPGYRRQSAPQPAP